MRWLGQLSDRRNVCGFNCLMSAKYKITCGLSSIRDHLDIVKSLWIRLEFCIDLSYISVNRDSIRDSTVGFVWKCLSIENPQHCVTVCEFTGLECERGSFKKITLLEIMIIMTMIIKMMMISKIMMTMMMMVIMIIVIIIIMMMMIMIKQYWTKFVKTWRAASASSRAGLAADNFFSATALSAYKCLPTLLVKEKIRGYLPLS